MPSSSVRDSRSRSRHRSSRKRSRSSRRRSSRKRHRSRSTRRSRSSRRYKSKERSRSHERRRRSRSRRSGRRSRDRSRSVSAERSYRSSVPAVTSSSSTTPFNGPSYFSNCSFQNERLDLLSDASLDGFPGPRKKRSRWAGNELDKTFIPGLPTTLPPNLSKEQERAYLLQLQIEELSRRLRCSDLGIPENPEDRSPSPEPIYDSHGKRLNTREVRVRKKFEDERHQLIQEMLKLNPEFKPPSDYKPQQCKFVDKVSIPQDDYPEINFVGLLIGPRGNTLKALEKETGAKIIIRGKGSVKDGKIGRKDGAPMPGEDEPLHAFITGTTPEIVSKATEKIKDIIKNGIEVPESMNELRKQQLRELALLNGTLRENDCLNKLKVLAQAETIITNTIICTICGGAGHIASDCKLKCLVDKKVLSTFIHENMDTEYTALMKELGQGAAEIGQLKTLQNVQFSGTVVNRNGPVLALPQAPVMSVCSSTFNSVTTVTTSGVETVNQAFQMPPVFTVAPPPPPPPPPAAAPPPPVQTYPSDSMVSQMDQMSQAMAVDTYSSSYVQDTFNSMVVPPLPPNPPFPPFQFMPPPAPPC